MINETSKDVIRDGIAALPEMEDIELELPLDRPKAEADDRLNEALLESFPASDPQSSGRME